VTIVIGNPSGEVSLIIFKEKNTPLLTRRVLPNFWPDFSFPAGLVDEGLEHSGEFDPSRGRSGDMFV
jgi:hypothetical protein